MTNDRPIHTLNYQWQSAIHFELPMAGQYYVGTIQSFPEVCSKGNCESPVVHINDLGDVEIYVNLNKTRRTKSIKMKH